MGVVRRPRKSRRSAPRTTAAAKRIHFLRFAVSGNGGRRSSPTQQERGWKLGKAAPAKRQAESGSCVQDPRTIRGLNTTCAGKVRTSLLPHQKRKNSHLALVSAPSDSTRRS